MEAAKGAWQVTAGVIPGDPLKRYELTLGYTSSDYEADKKTAEANCMLMMQKSDSSPGSSFADAASAGVDGVEDTIFMKNCVLALAHAREVMDPQRINWVRVDFIWY